MGDENTANSKRLFSLDALRGLDMILLTVVAPLVNAAQRGWKCFPDSFMHQFNHYWCGFTLFDIIMPLFIFMCGAAIPLALEKRLAAGGGFWRHVLGRVALLWVAGGLVQGNWITLDPLSISPFSNTLQSIAVGYLVVAAVLYARKNILAIVVPVACAVVYTVALAAYGDYDKFGNLAYKIDISILGAVLPTGNRWVENPSYYTWFFTSLMFVVMAFAGYHATRILQRVEGGGHLIVGLPYPGLSEDLIVPPGLRLEKARILQPVLGQPVPGDGAQALPIRACSGYVKFPQPVEHFRIPSGSFQCRRRGLPGPAQRGSVVGANRQRRNALREAFRFTLSGLGQ